MQYLGRRWIWGESLLLERFWLSALRLWEGWWLKQSRDNGGQSLFCNMDNWNFPQKNRNWWEMFARQSYNLQFETPGLPRLPRLRDSRDSQDSGTPKTPGLPRLPEDRWKKWKRPVASFTALQTIFKFRFKPKNVGWGFLSSSQEDDPHQPWGAPPHFRHLLPCVESWWTGHPDHLHRGWTAQSQSGHPAGPTISSLPWCTSPSPCATDRLVLFSFLYFCTRPLWSKELSPTPPPSPPRASSEGTLQCKSCSIPGFPGSWQGWHCISAMFSATPPTTINCVNMVDQVCGKKSQYSALLLPAWWQGRQRGKHQRKWGQTWRCIITIPLLITTIHNSNASSTEASHGLHWVLEHLGGHPHQQRRFTQMSRGHLHFTYLCIAQCSSLWIDAAYQRLLWRNPRVSHG